MNKPVNPPKTPAQKDQDDWVRIGDAAAEVIRKIAEKKGNASGKN